MNTDKIEQYLLLTKGLRGLGLSQAIVKATGEPGLFTFGELLALPHVQELASGEFSSTLSLVQMFAYGTWSSYKAQAENGQMNSSLSAAQQRKLKALSVASLAKSRRTLPYSDLMAELQMESLRQLEDFLISECIYSGVIKGRLDQKRRCLHVEDALPRDVPPPCLDEILGTLDDWLEGAASTLRGIDAQMTYVRSASTALQHKQKERDQAIEKCRSAVKNTLDGKARLEIAAMSVDEGDVMALLEDVGGEGDARPSGSRVTKRRR